MRITLLLFLSTLAVQLGMAQAPTHLTTDLLEHTDRVFLDGYPASISLAELGTAVERYQLAEIRNPQPYLGWVVNSDKPNTLQTAYRILVATSPQILEQNKADMWDSGPTQSDNSVAVRYEGKPLRPANVYYWKVKTSDNHGTESDFSQTRSFITAADLDGKTARYPLQIDDEQAVELKALKDGNIFVDFGKAAFGRLKLTLTSDTETATVLIHLGERLKNGRIDRNPGETIRYSCYRLALMRGTHTYTLKIKPDKRNTDLRGNTSSVKPVLMPDYIGEVTPFRACELENYSGTIKTGDIIRNSVHYPFDETAASFSSSNIILNKIWDLCKYSIKATNFAETYVDGDRERLPYEREALISQLGQYCADREFSMARHSYEYLLFHPTWPTEWQMHSVWMAWNDYLYTGNAASLQKYYNDIKAKTLLGLKESNGLISSKTGKQTPQFFASIHLNAGKSKLRDIVDWPNTPALGNRVGGETDGFVFSDYNGVINAWHYFALCLMTKIADATGNISDREDFTQKAQQMKTDFNRHFFDTKRGCYRDGIGTNHASLHANMYPVAFGLVPEKNKNPVIEFIHSRGMACSISGALMLMEALYAHEDAQYALELLSSSAERSWYNTIRIGSTLTIEAWDNKYKPNLDWNQSAGSAPVNIIPRKLMGIEPLEPGFKKIRIKPQPATLRHAEIKTPSIRGDIRVSFDNQPGKRFALQVEIPANSVAEVWLPQIAETTVLTVDDVVTKGIVAGKFVKVNIGSGKHSLLIVSTSTQNLPIQ
jgi:hypothetical protein